ncbi:MAG TPA: prepilin peptidase [Stellaceae bacterium]|nr:prepilin peptidase [Stellaceae bacterium]
MQRAVLCLAIGALALAAYGDLRRRRIPNAVSLAVAALGCARLLLAADIVAAGRTLAAAAIVLVLTAILFWRGVCGGGDAKLLAAATLLVGYRDLGDFLILTALLGAALVPVILLTRRIAPWLHPAEDTLSADAPTDAVASVKAARTTVPYGVAISGACSMLLIIQTAMTR